MDLHVVAHNKCLSEKEMNHLHPPLTTVKLWVVHLVHPKKEKPKIRFSVQLTFLTLPTIIDAFLATQVLKLSLLVLSHLDTESPQIKLDPVQTVSSYTGVGWSALTAQEEMLFVLLKFPYSRPYSQSFLTGPDG